MNNVYIGERYVPIFAGTWSAIDSYEPLTIVQYGNNSYTSKRHVPVGIAPTDTNYWLLTGNYNGQISNLQNQIDDINNNILPPIINDVNALDNDVNAMPVHNKFRNKTICIIGDSISDTTTYPPNWTVAIKSKLLALGATSVTNAAITGSSLVGFGNDPTLIPTGYDIYIIALGVNDWQGQFKTSDIYNAIYAIVNRINLANCEAFYVSPIKCYLSSWSDRFSPLSAYRALCEAVFADCGVTVISGFNMPKLNTFTETIYLADTLHPASVFREIYADYVLNAMIAGTSTFSPHDNNFNINATMHPDATYSNGGAYIQWRSANEYRLAITLLDLQLASGWNNICYVSKSGNDEGLIEIDSGYKFNETNGDVYQIRQTGATVQVYSPSAITTNLYLTTTGMVRLPQIVD